MPSELFEKIKGVKIAFGWRFSLQASSDLAGTPDRCGISLNTYTLILLLRPIHTHTTFIK